MLANAARHAQALANAAHHASLKANHAHQTHATQSGTLSGSYVIDTQGRLLTLGAYLAEGASGDAGGKAVPSSTARAAAADPAGLGLTVVDASAIGQGAGTGSLGQAVIHPDVAGPTVGITTGVSTGIQGGKEGTFIITSSTSANVTVMVSIQFTGPNASTDLVTPSSGSYIFPNGNVGGVVSGPVTLVSPGSGQPATATLLVVPSNNVSTSSQDDAAVASLSTYGSYCCCGGSTPPTFSPGSASLTLWNTGSVSISLNGSSNATTSGGAPGAPATFDVKYTGNPSHAVNVKIDGTGRTAIPGTDYTYTVTGGSASLSQTNGTVTIPAGTTDVYIQVTPQSPTVTTNKTIELAVIGGNACIINYGTVGYWAVAPLTAKLMINHPNVNVEISSVGMHSNDQTPIPNMVQGMSWSGQISLIGVNTDNYSLVNYTWSFPQNAAIKDYGYFATINPNDANGDTDGPYDIFQGSPTNNSTNQVKYETFNSDDLQRNFLQVGDHWMDKFY